MCSKSGLPALRIVIGRYGYKSSFVGANKKVRLGGFWVGPLGQERLVDQNLQFIFCCIGSLNWPKIGGDE